MQIDDTLVCQTGPESKIYLIMQQEVTAKKGSQRIVKVRKI